MVIAGAKGLAKEVLEIFAQKNALENLFFFDNISNDLPENLFDRFPVITNIESLKQVFSKTGDYRFTLGLGNPVLRKSLTDLLASAGGVLSSAISSGADVGQFNNSIGFGTTILSGVVITNGVTIGEGCLVNPHCSISHDSVLGKFVELSPGARVTGHCRIGDYSMLGTNAVLIPKVQIGTNVIVAAGAVVTRDVPDNTLVAGVPAVIKKKLEPVRL
jgi:sugar O-acyltransferase (sialic acid O-acetyltransferase NeuD family)